MITITFYIWLTVAFAFVILVLWLILAKREESISSTRVRSRFGEPRETDLRLTYKRFRELYPHSKIAYREYKELQARKAFKRAVSSQDIKRMVR
jgi:hypothetical protein